MLFLILEFWGSGLVLRSQRLSLPHKIRNITEENLLLQKTYERLKAQRLQT